MTTEELYDLIKPTIKLEDEKRIGKVIFISTLPEDETIVAEEFRKFWENENKDKYSKPRD